MRDGDRTLQDLPRGGPGVLVLPDLGLTTTVLDVADPAGDDHGPGDYRYPSDGVFAPQVFDLSRFSVGYDDRNLVFTFEIFGPLTNPWGSPNGLALQTLDVYVDTDPGSGTGARLLLPGRNAALADGFGWEAAVWAEGWTPQFLIPNSNGVPKPDGSVAFRVITDPADHRITLRVPREPFGDGDPATWAYTAILLSQDGFPSPGVWRVRDILAEAGQWRFGGARDDVNHTRIIDVAWAGGTEPGQESMLSDYPASEGPLADSAPEAFPRIQMLIPQGSGP